ncbi:MAG: phage holin family protein [Candidatus Sungbacteria bacterium]|nr:phage holin family protein [Candidatus Sungbacteria bacterium]
MNVIVRFAIKVGLNAFALYALAAYLPGFTLATDAKEFFFAALILALVHLILRPILAFISFPFILITFGLFNIIINVILLLIGDFLTPAITISDTKTLLIASVVIGLANALL